MFSLAILRVSFEILVVKETHIVTLDKRTVSQTFRCVLIPHYREKTYPLSDVCYHPDHFDALVKLLGETRRVHKRLNYSVKR